MRKPVSLLAALSLFVVATCGDGSGLAASANRPGSVAITATFMGLGDSITVDINGAGNAYRALLAAGHPNLQQVGGVSKNGYNFEGHSGFTSADILSNISTYYGANKADIVFLHIGTNDPIGGAPLTPAQTATNVASICTTIRGIKTTAKIIVAAPIINSTTPYDIYNADYAAAGTAIRTAVSSLPYVYPISMPFDLVAGDLVDGEHPNATGYGKMYPPLHRQLVDMGYLTLNH